MLAISFTFPAGRYHATPWDRHVNEGAVAWPPEPWRFLRALISTWHHKIKYSEKHQESALRALIDSLAVELPQYTLPAASHSHTRHYMPQWKAGSTSLVFDAFVAVSRNEHLYITWPNLDLPNDQARLLENLLEVMSYLGRAESWVKGRRVLESPAPNCIPGDQTLDQTTGEILGEIVTLFAPLPADEYLILREQFLSDKRTVKKLSSTLPETLLDAISVETSDLRKHGWSQPPAARKVHYVRPLDALRPKRVPRKDALPVFNTVRYLLVGKPLPRVEDSVRIGELLRQAVMSQAKRELGEDAIPPIISGHDLPPGNRHQHAFYLPWDANGDGRIDRLLLHVPAGMGLKERRILEKLHRIWSRNNGEWQLVLEDIGDVSIGGQLMQHSREWHSTTPYLHPWHVKKGLGIEAQILRECSERNLPEPIALERLEHIRVGKQTRRPVHFLRFRRKYGLNQPDRHGSFWRINFSEPVSGPLALGFGCHFGLGLFAPINN
ncbi:MAG: type I-U CRISPR-associated protein Csb2 [Actinomycetota bacterium]|jgi:CRISPR-associated protein Csb2|nr:type I-U CRISPR-associated protein Csb2 [Actinomycetota bacterium]MCL6094205.1 type I-U CRISPR-associated protein Csb2 [Actinomycetota bacterium]MDA8167451.1 type I-U CRISPR-associated protein Csb2 [Actinomycetota bacterium]